MDVHDVFFSDIVFHLANGFDERKRLNIPYCSTNLRDDDVCARFFSSTEDTVFDFVRDVWNDLNCSTVVVSTAFLLEDRRVNTTRRDVRVLAQVDVDEALVVTKVKVRLCAIICDENFPVLVRAHRTRVDVDVRVEFLDRDVKATVFQETSE